MKLYIYAAAALLWIISVGGAGVFAYRHGVEFQKGVDAAAALPAWQQAVKDVTAAQKDAAQARTDQAQAAEQHAKELSDAKANIRIQTVEIPKYVAQMPPDPHCDITDGLFDYLNKAAAATGDP
jgi:hypothetical protein